MAIADITPDTVHAAIRAGHDDVYKLAAYFGVKHVNPDLRSTLYRLDQDGRICRTEDYTFTAH